ncbi:MAG: translation initiation factor [Methylacidiphilales bacterium]|nr:translation initiation factor [Candidatus Methylacidiphilales bacterium]
MSKKDPASKIDVTGPSGGLQNPFQSLELSGLPPGPANVESIPEKAGAMPAKRGRVVLRRETAHRGGKTVVVVGDIPETVSDEEIEKISRDLRKACCCGGTLRGREIEIQGDQPARVCQLLEEMGFRVAGVTKTF